MAVITELSHSTIERALTQYDVGTLTRFKAATEGIENTNYFIKTRKRINGQEQSQEFVFTLVEELGGDAQARKIMVDILDRCDQYGLPVPRLIRTKDGTREGRVLDKPVLLCRKLSGSHVLHPVKEHCEAIGRFLARFHLATASMEQQVKPYIRGLKWLNDCIAQVEADVSPAQSYLLQKSLKVVTSLLKRQDVSRLPRSVIHADLFRDNALFDSYGLTGIVDFYHAGTGFQIYDLAVAINDWCVFNGEVDEHRAVALLRAYRNIRPFEPLEEAYLCHFLLYGALAFWLSRLVIAVKPDLPEDYPVKDPEEFEALVDQHLHTPFRLPVGA